MEITKAAKRLVGDKTLLFLCDAQNKFAPKAYKHHGVVESIGMLCKVAKLFNLPTLITEHNAPVSGNTYSEFIKNLDKTPYMKKSKT
jgi:nicotinamidase-related amidase